MGRIFVVDLEGKAYRCQFCKTHLALYEDLVSRESVSEWDIIILSRLSLPKQERINKVAHTECLKSIENAFNCRKGKAYLFNNVVNIMVGHREERMMLSGLHTVADIFCCRCGQIVGWKYVAAHEKSQKYKEGKFVLERGRIIDGVDSEFYIDTHPSMSDAEDP